MNLIELSRMIVNNSVISKFDHIATIYIDGRYYFKVFRRYNSDFNIMIQDYNDDIYLHQDFIVKESLNTIMCTQSNMYTMDGISIKHNGPIPSLIPDIENMRWTEVHGKYQTVIVNIHQEIESNYTILRNGRKILKD